MPQFYYIIGNSSSPPFRPCPSAPPRSHLPSPSWPSDARFQPSAPWVWSIWLKVMNEMYHHQFIIKNSIKAPPFIMISMYVFRNQVNEPNQFLGGVLIDNRLCLDLLCTVSWRLAIVFCYIYYIYIFFISFLNFYFLLDFTQKQKKHLLSEFENDKDLFWK